MSTSFNIVSLFNKLFDAIMIGLDNFLNTVSLEGLSNYSIDYSIFSS